uniref:Mitochondrial-processing peptidase subunit alpha n=1 Tax=Panagrellus redivivus TaxID=6233 RepID=A0A7E4VEN8_PANRE
MYRKVFNLSNRHAIRQISTTSSTLRQSVPLAGVDLTKIPLTEPIPGLESVAPVARKKAKKFDTKLTVLPTGLTIASEGALARQCTIGVAINSGPRYEANYPLGVSHFIEKSAFSHTRNFDAARIQQVTEEQNALLDCQSTKDTFLYASSCSSDGFDEILNVIGEAVLKPVFDQESVNLAADIIQFENQNLARNPECEPLLIDWIHTAAFQGNTLGFSRYCNPANIPKITAQHLYSFVSQYHDPSRIVVAAVGIDHDALVATAQRCFDPAQTSWALDPSLCLPKMPELDNSVAQYTGGEHRVVRDLSKMALGPREFPNLAHFVLGFESVGIQHPDFVPFCVLNTLMGGGGSFSAGGPGKGMFTRLYVDVLHHYHWMYNATAYNHSYTDSGVFSIRASGTPGQFNFMVKIVLNEFFRLVKGVRPDELARAKIQLKSQILMNLEMRPVQFEDLARQVLSNGSRIKPEEYAEKIDAVTDADIRRIAERMLSTKPAVVGYGDLKEMPSYEKIDAAVAKRDINEINQVASSGLFSAFNKKL